ncbi:MAG: hypothetical protein ACJAWK_000281 [Candidatus Azotimanducaceae bacterium]|jgi:hypothetical protein
MTIVNVTEDVAGPAADVFAILGDFAGVQIGGPITAVEYDGEGVGMVRSISLGGGLIVERLEAHDPIAMHFAYCITNDDCVLPVSGYTSNLQITDLGPQGCRVEWIGNFEPRGLPEADVMPIIEGIYRNGIAGARKVVTG